jgi:transcriptional regulator with XRE-family HTH domain
MESNTAMLRLSEIAARIKEMRDIMGWSVGEMAQKTEVTREQYLIYENAQADIPFTFIHKCDERFKTIRCSKRIFFIAYDFDFTITVQNLNIPFFFNQTYIFIEITKQLKQLLYFIYFNNPFYFNAPLIYSCF